MAVERKQIGETEIYRGHEIVVRLMGPDLLAYVDGVELSGFYINSAAASRAGQRHIDAEIRAAEESKKEKRA